MKNAMLSKTLVISVVVLFIGVGGQSVFAVDIPEKEEIEPKDYLFETIVAIANNPDVQNLFEEYKNNINLDYNNRYLFRQLLFKNSELLCSMVFTKTKTTTQYLDKSYDQGIELIDIYGEEKTHELLDSVKLKNPEILDDLNDIVMNDEELSDRILKLSFLNNETNPICYALAILGIRAIIKWISLDWLEFLFSNVQYLELFFMARAWLVIPQIFIIGDLLNVFDCWGF
jgi:hypothetical protein